MEFQQSCQDQLLPHPSSLPGQRDPGGCPSYPGTPISPWDNHGLGEAGRQQPALAVCPSPSRAGTAPGTLPALGAPHFQPSFPRDALQQLLFPKRWSCRLGQPGILPAAEQGKTGTTNHSKTGTTIPLLCICPVKPLGWLNYQCYIKPAQLLATDPMEAQSHRQQTLPFIIFLSILFGQFCCQLLRKFMASWCLENCCGVKISVGIVSGVLCLCGESSTSCCPLISDRKSLNPK